MAIARPAVDGATVPPLVAVAIGWLVGLSAARWADLWLIVPVAAALGVVLLLRRTSDPGWLLTVLALAGAVAAIGRVTVGATELPEAPPNGTVAVRGTVATWPRATERGQAFELALSQARVGTAWQPSAARLLVYLPAYPAAALGQAIEVVGRPRPLGSEENARTRAQLRRDGMGGTLVAGPYIALAAAPTVGSGRESAVGQIRRALAAALPVSVAALAAGLLVGDRGDLAAETRQAFQTTGVAHLLAVSGWNMTLVGAVAAWLAMRFGRRQPVLVLVGTGAALAIYAWLCGADASVIRAAIMGGLAAVALAVGRRTDPVVALFAAAMVMTAWQPAWGGDLGFQLSFLATAGLLLCMPAVLAALRRFPAWASVLLGPLATTLVAQLAVEPLLAHTFGRVTPIAPLVNLPVEPLATVVLLGSGLIALVGMAAGTVGTVSVPVLTELIAFPTGLAGSLLLTLVEAAARLPLASVAIPPPPEPVVAAAYLVMGVALWPQVTAAPGETYAHLWRWLVAERATVALLALVLVVAGVWQLLVG